MNTFKLLVLSLLLFGGEKVCRANLGETEAQCTTRYGGEFDVHDNLAFDVIGDKDVSFNLKVAKGSFVMNVIFLNGIDVLEKITSADTSRDISEIQKQAILDSERAGFKWTKQNTTYNTDRSGMTAGIEYWLRTDGAIARCWLYGKPQLQHGWGEIDLSTEDYTSAQRALDRQNGAR